MDIKYDVPVKIHNRFDVHIEDVVTGEKSLATAYNVVLDAVWPIILNRTAVWFTNIRIGSGTGTLDPANTTLFTDEYGKAATEVSVGGSYPLYFHTRKVELGISEANGVTITEVGISRANGQLMTHAFLEDAEGNQISIEKTSTKIVTIYATVYAEFVADTHGGKFMLHLTAPDSQGIVGACTGRSTLPPSSMTVYATRSKEARFPYGLYYPDYLGGATTAVSPTADLVNKRITYGPAKFLTTAANGPVGGFHSEGLFQMMLPFPGVFAGHVREDIVLGSGDGTRTCWVAPEINMDASTVVVDVDGVEETGVTLTQYPTPVVYSSIALQAANVVTEPAVWDNEVLMLLSTGVITARNLERNHLGLSYNLYSGLTMTTSSGAGWSLKVYGDFLFALRVRLSNTCYLDIFELSRGLDGLVDAELLVSTTYTGDMSVCDIVYHPAGYVILASQASGSLRWWSLDESGGVYSLTALSGPATNVHYTQHGRLLLLDGDLLFVASTDNGPQAMVYIIDPLADTITWLDDYTLADGGSMPPSVAKIETNLYLIQSAIFKLDVNDELELVADFPTKTIYENIMTFGRVFRLSIGGTTHRVYALHTNDELIALEDFTVTSGTSIAPGDGSITKPSFLRGPGGVDGTHYPVSAQDEGYTFVDFTAAPDAAAALTTSHTINGIHKDTLRTIDVTVTFQFGEPVV